MIVDFAIEDDPKRAIFIRNRLVAARHIDNAEAPHADANSAVGIKAVVVRSAMGNEATHFAQRPGAGTSIMSEFKNSSDAAH
jgi:hypothetical protein